MYDIYMWNRNTDNKIYITTFTTSEEAELFVRLNMKNDFVYYIKAKKHDTRI